MPLVEKRYAEALVDIAVHHGTIDEYQQELGQVIQVLSEQPDFMGFLLNPQITVQAKKDTALKAFDEKIHPELVNFLLLLLDKRRIGLLPGITKEFIILSDKIKNTINMKIVSAMALNEQQINDIMTKYVGINKISYAKVDVEIDKDLIGGVKVIVGDKVIDGSVKGRLESLKQILVD